MHIRILGAHNCESKDTKFSCILVDEILSIDAGGLTSSLSFSEHLKLKGVLLTHRHYDHIRDTAALAISFYFQNSHVNVLCTHSTYDTLLTHILNGITYPKFREHPPANPSIRFRVLKPYQIELFESYSILPIPLNHSDPGAVGYQLTSTDGKSIFYSGDTGIGLEDCWRRISPKLLFIEVTWSNRSGELARKVGHLTPGLLKDELMSFQKINGYLPGVVAMHMTPFMEEEIRAELEAVARELDCSITAARESMLIQV